MNHLEVKETIVVEDLGNPNPNTNEELDKVIILALRGINEDSQLEDGMELSTTLDWLKERMNKKIVEEVQPIEDIDDFCARIGKAKEQKKAKKFSHITRDNLGSHILQVAVPTID